MQGSRNTTDFRSRLKAAAMIRKDFSRLAIFLFILSGMINVLALTGSIYMMQVYDRALTSGSVETLGFLSILALSLYLFHGSFDAIRSHILVKLGARLDHRLTPIAHRIAIDMPRFGYSTTEALERSRSVDNLRGFLSSGAPSAVFDLPWMPIFLIFVYMLHPVLGLVTAAGAVVLALLTVVAELRSRHLTQATQSALVARNAAAESNARNADVIAAMGVADRAVHRYEALNDEHLGYQTRGATAGSTISSYSRVLRMILQSGLLGLGAYFTINGQMSAGAIIAVSVASSRALAPIDQVIANWRNILGARHSYQQLRDTLAAWDRSRETMAHPLPKASLKVENVTVASPESGRVLISDLTFDLKAGQALAIIGPSGGGKSTLMRALAGVWSPLRGSIRLDEIALDHYDPSMRGDFIGYLPQEVNLFTGTIADNIGRMAENGNGELVRKAADFAGVHQMVARMPDGYETRVESGGAGLSAGQRQRIGLARALYGEPFVVLLDEPNAALDAQGEQALNTAITAIRDRGGIVIVVAHRTNVLAAVDTVAVVHNGRLAAFGPRDEVLGKSGSLVTSVDFQNNTRAPAAGA
ncbi:type I secretion system permease/ATPase [Maritimibacter sp. DP1N21-5]|uniref:type I secretion system permease/ATPase n=1 Tax=Maritimibacter sp. DP1N21-5 TaxID=2836867 RepID=UPI001C4500F3|nr:type I secretion system permease/ATPase [Maritimibacter sp. DP1N21-5]MBV7407547.1 type I secretion system permease/ATPase [Maritimibacter sp. DP1N21-5]